MLSYEHKQVTHIAERSVKQLQIWKGCKQSLSKEWNIWKKIYNNIWNQNMNLFTEELNNIDFISGELWAVLPNYSNYLISIAEWFERLQGQINWKRSRLFWNVKGDRFVPFWKIWNLQFAPILWDKLHFSKNWNVLICKTHTQLLISIIIIIAKLD